jgi:hypothetical protein
MTQENAQNPITMAESPTVSFRVEPETAKRAEALAKALAKQPAYAGLSLTKSRVYAMALLRGLDLLEEEHRTVKKGGRK